MFVVQRVRVKADGKPKQTCHGCGKKGLEIIKDNKGSFRPIWHSTVDDTIPEFK